MGGGWWAVKDGEQEQEQEEKQQQRVIGRRTGTWYRNEMWIGALHSVLLVIALACILDFAVTSGSLRLSLVICFSALSSPMGRNHQSLTCTQDERIFNAGVEYREAF